MSGGAEAQGLIWLKAFLFGDMRSGLPASMSKRARVRLDLATESSTDLARQVTMSVELGDSHRADLARLAFRQPEAVRAFVAFSKHDVSGRKPIIGEQVMMDICGFLSRWFAEERFWNAALRTEVARVNELPDNVVYVDFKAIREAKEGTCERRL
ncbi:hypothetical protein NLM16_15965 [Bradyrhizobium brasilense]|uniref:Uncharacterized protein n=1 Tax=Bradyrhizobium brasilense TaxID=1419277 RepID=A0ABY8JA35_9BRAD|nr:hypothetical protein [Bradyrhizobium brasilense]MCP3415610.1 hypothetical protein [Bradyrhizobium brasilense]WFU62422.1 hypothetical protein QA636_33765 [Bradyrhizobium brasilense]